ncbi:phage portal protein [Oerskovia sp. Root22]|uniref:phage portal protein n=1 Tax=Oerskovia sp. Root22 TaxID=1736494 RepID=UPI0006FB4E66|nr:phage portal protein [Oerskovia sp. Root22]KRC37515.1 hypothetical protein ASE15_05220 [Oerskovia sp. Root22]
MDSAEILRLATLMADKIRARRPDIVSNVAYFKGTEGRMRFASDEFRDYFADRFSGFSDNWCMPVAQAPIERIHQLGIRLDGSTTADVESARMWERNEADRGLSEALMMMTVAKRSFGMVSPSPVGARVTFEHPDSACVIYDAATRQRRAGMVVWQDENFEYSEFQTPQYIIPLKRPRFIQESGDKHVAPNADGWAFDQARELKANPLGAVPLVEFRNQALLDDEPMSDIAGVKPIQDTINLVWAYLLNGLDTASLPARIIKGIDVPKEPILDQDGQIIGERPIELDRLIRDRVIFIPGEGDVAEWTAGNLEVFSKVIGHAVEHVVAQTRTPAHYLIAASSNTPATGYELAEAGLVSKAAERISYANPSVREIYRLAAIAEGQAERAAQIAVGKVLWKKPQYRSEQQLMDGLQKMRTAGFPFQWIAEEYGLSPSEVDRVMEMKRTEERDATMEQVARDLAI